MRRARATGDHRGPGAPSPPEHAAPRGGTAVSAAPWEAGDTGGLLSFEEASARALAFLDQQMPMAMWAITRCDGDDQVFTDVRTRDYDVLPHPRVSWEGSLCRRMVAGAARVAARTRDVPEYAACVPVEEWPVRAYVGAPIRLDDGPVLGTVCGYHPTELEQPVLERVQPAVELVADMLSQILLGQSLREQALIREAELRRLATRDHLTGLATRAVLHARLAHALELHESTRRPLSVLLVDVDDLKTVNDTHGHATGDALLVAVATAWKPLVTSGNTLARLGGDEFALLVECGCDVAEIVDRVRPVLSQRLDVAGAGRTVTVSAGLAHLPAEAPTPTPADLLARADAAMYAAKRSGGARLVRYDARPEPRRDRGPDALTP